MRKVIIAKDKLEDQKQEPIIKTIKVKKINS